MPIDQTLLTRIEDNDETLKEVDLSHKRLTWEDVVPLATALKKNKFVTTLHIHDNQLGDKGVEVLVSALKDNTSLESIGLALNQIGTEGAKSIAELLKTNKTLKVVLFDYTHMGIEGMRAFVPVIEASISLSTLTFHHSEIDDDSVKVLAQALEKSTSLISIGLSDNKISDVGAEVLVSALEKNFSFTVAVIQNNNVSEYIQNQIHVLERRNRALAQPYIGAEQDYRKALALIKRKDSSKEEEIVDTFLAAIAKAKQGLSKYPPSKYLLEAINKDFEVYLKEHPTAKAKHDKKIKSVPAVPVPQPTSSRKLKKEDMAHYSELTPPPPSVEHEAHRAEEEKQPSVKLKTPTEMPAPPSFLLPPSSQPLDDVLADALQKFTQALQEQKEAIDEALQHSKEQYLGLSETAFAEQQARYQRLGEEAFTKELQAQQKLLQEAVEKTLADTQPQAMSLIQQGYQQALKDALQQHPLDEAVSRSPGLLEKITQHVHRQLDDHVKTQLNELVESQAYLKRVQTLQDEILSGIKQRQEHLTSEVVHVNEKQKTLTDKQAPLYKEYQAKQQKLAEQQTLKQYSNVCVFYNTLEKVLSAKLISAMALVSGMIKREDTKTDKLGALAGNAANALISAIPVVGPIVGGIVGGATSAGISARKDNQQHKKYENTWDTLLHFDDAIELAELIARRLAQSHRTFITGQKLSDKKAEAAGEKAANIIYDLIKSGELKTLAQASVKDKVEALIKAFYQHPKAQSIFGHLEHGSMQPALPLPGFSPAGNKKIDDLVESNNRLDQKLELTDTHAKVKITELEKNVAKMEKQLQAQEQSFKEQIAQLRREQQEKEEQFRKEMEQKIKRELDVLRTLLLSTSTVPESSSPTSPSSSPLLHGNSSNTLMPPPKNKPNYQEPQGNDKDGLQLS